MAKKKKSIKKKTKKTKAKSKVAKKKYIAVSKSLKKKKYVAKKTVPRGTPKPSVKITELPKEPETFSDKEIREMEREALVLQKKIQAAKGKQAKKEGKEIPKAEVFNSGTIAHLNSEIKDTEKRKYPKKYADDLEKKVKMQEHFNKKIHIERRKLKKEQVTRGTSGYRVRQIDQILRGKLPVPLKFTDKEIKKNKLPDSVKKKTFLLTPQDVSFDKNQVNLYKGKDFYFYFDDGFNKYKVKQSELIKRINKGEHIGQIALDKMKKTVAKWQKENDDYLAVHKGRMTKKNNKYYNNKNEALKNLLKVIEANKRFIETQNEDALGDSYVLNISLIGTKIKI